MKKSLVLLPFLLLFSLNVGAQENKSFYLGLLINPDFAWFEEENNSRIDSDPKIGIGYGLFVDFKLWKKFYCSFGAMDRIGQLEADYLINDTSYLHVITYNSIEVPFALKARIGNKTAGIVPLVGIMPQFVHDAKANLNPGFDGIFQKNVNFKKQVKEISYKLIIGLDLDYGLGERFSLTGGVRFSKWSDEFVKNPYNINLSPRSISIAAGILFHP